MFFIAQPILGAFLLLITSQNAFSAQQRSTSFLIKEPFFIEIIKLNPKQLPFLKMVQASTENNKQSPSSTCRKEDFESVVDKAAGVLRDLNFKNKPHFQDKLKELKEKRGWSDAVFEKEAPRFVKDEEIDRLDSQTLDLLAKITAMGDEGSSAKLPNCSLLETLQKYMQDLIDTQTEKWTYMFQKIDTETTQE
ncbi:MAG: hypothetical protein ACKOW3_00710 [Hyphomicrobium sp.]